MGGPGGFKGLSLRSGENCSLLASGLSAEYSNSLNAVESMGEGRSDVLHCMSWPMTSFDYSWNKATFSIDGLIFAKLGY